MEFRAQNIKAFHNLFSDVKRLKLTKKEKKTFNQATGNRCNFWLIFYMNQFFELVPFVKNVY